VPPGFFKLFPSATGNKKGGRSCQELAGLIRGLPERSWPERRLPPAVMLVEHHMDLVMRVCQEVAVLDFGRLIATGTPAQVRENPAVTDAYLGTAA